jgi:transposase
VFQVHDVDRDGAVVVRRRLRRSRVLPFFATVEPCRIGIEACATGYYWARELRALGHDPVHRRSRSLRWRQPGGPTWSGDGRGACGQCLVHVLALPRRDFEASIGPTTQQLFRAHVE